MFILARSVVLVVSVLWALSGGGAHADGTLDGRVFKGMIGPEGSADLADSLHFDNGHFWSDICTKCGFVPGTYTTEQTADGVLFRGVLKSETSGQFSYKGRANEDGSLSVAISWEKRRWYWTARRDIVFEGAEVASADTITLAAIRAKMGNIDPSDTPLCARF